MASIPFLPEGEGLTLRETIDFRIPEDHAAEYLPGAGEPLSSGVRRVVVMAGDPLYREIGRLHDSFQKQGRSFFFGNTINREYTSRELSSADWFVVRPKRTFEPAGEECGTRYDESTACTICGACAKQISALCVDSRKIPGNIDFARTIAGEVIVSSAAAQVFARMSLIGMRLAPVYLINRSNSLSEHWFQLRSDGPPVHIDRSRTRAGRNVFDDSSWGACPLGHVIGLRALSEIWFVSAQNPEVDFMRTAETAGVRQGLLRPEPFLLISRRARSAIVEAKLRGFVFEVAHAVSMA
jgi:hypothetical protein